MVIMKKNILPFYIGASVGFGIAVLNFFLVFFNLSASLHTNLSYLAVPIIIGNTSYLSYKLGKQRYSYLFTLIHTLKSLYIGLAIGQLSLWILTWIRLDQVLMKAVYISLAGVDKSHRVTSLISQYISDAISSTIVSTIVTITVSSIAYWISRLIYNLKKNKA